MLVALISESIDGIFLMLLANQVEHAASLFK